MGRCVKWRDFRLFGVAGRRFICFTHSTQTVKSLPNEGYFLFYPFGKKPREYAVKKGFLKMKKIATRGLSLVLALGLMLSLAACGAKEVEKSELWETATYTADTEFGEGKTPLKVIVKAGEQSVTFTINTDKKTVGEALLEHKLIEGEQGDYGLYIKSVNGIVADYDADKTYWAFYEGEEYAAASVDATNITEGVTYKLERTK